MLKEKEVKKISDFSDIPKEVTTIILSLKCLKDEEFCKSIKEGISKHVSAVFFKGNLDDYLQLIESPQILEKLLPKHILSIKFSGTVLQQLSEGQQRQLINNLPDSIKQVNFYNISCDGYEPSIELMKHVIDKNMTLCSHRASYLPLYQKYNCLTLNCHSFIHMDKNSFKEKMDNMPGANKLYLIGQLGHYSDNKDLIIEKFKMLDERFESVDLQKNDLLCFGIKNIVQLIKALPDSVKRINISGNGFFQDPNISTIGGIEDLFKIFHEKNIEVIAEHEVVHEYHNYCKKDKKIVIGDDQCQAAQNSNSEPVLKQDNQESSSPPYLVYSAGLMLAAASFYALTNI